MDEALDPGIGKEAYLLQASDTNFPAVHVLGAACAAPLCARVDALRGVVAEGAVWQ